MADGRGFVIGARIVSGTIAAGVAAVVVGAVALVPLPSHVVEPRTVTVQPAPADQVRVCPGGVVRLGDAGGASTDQAFAIGSPEVAVGIDGGEVERAHLASSDPGAAAASSPQIARVPPPSSALVSAAQSLEVDAPDFRGFAAAACGEPTGSAWLVGGATTVGRSTFLLLSNPTEVEARVSLEIFGESGRVSAPGLAGIVVPAGAQRVLSLAGFAPGAVSPVVHVTARGGRVVATLQQSIVRGLDAVGVEFIGAGADPSPSLVVPGVRIVDAVGTNRATALVDWQDVAPIVRLGVPGDADARVSVRVVPEGADGVGMSFEVDVPAGEVRDFPLDTAGGDEIHADEPDDGTPHVHGLTDGTYSVFIDAEVPVVAGVRASTAVDIPTSSVDLEATITAPPSDVAWFAAAAPLVAETMLAVPTGPSPLVTLANPTVADATVEFLPTAGGPPIVVTAPAGRSASLGLAPGTYRVTGTDSVAIAVSYAGPGVLASFTLAPPRPVAGSVVVHPD